MQHAVKLLPIHMRLIKHYVHANGKTYQRLGQGGHNMKSIARECDGKVRVRGRGSSYLEGPHPGAEADLPLQVSLSAHHVNFDRGFAMLAQLLDGIGVQYRWDG